MTTTDAEKIQKIVDLIEVNFARGTNILARAGADTFFDTVRDPIDGSFLCTGSESDIAESSYDAGINRGKEDISEMILDIINSTYNES